MIMNPVITFDDYKTTGTMETALSEHADEAFFELSAEKQKIAEKIFKCLTETDRENREIRRAMTVEKLCAVSEADFAEVADVIETFRREGRTFLMPPPEVPLKENSLIDISHESLIRKWERLKKWVEEEGQSAQTYRRLAEDALLHQKGKVGFWSDPELKDALEWREDFKPNETWARLYKETGERQYKASFEDSMQYLNDSQSDRDKKIAKEKRQRTTLIVLSILFFMTTVLAGFAAYKAQKNAQEAKKNQEEALLFADKARASEEKTKKANETLEITNDKLEKSQESLQKSNDELEKSENSLLKINDELEASLADAEEQKKRADSEARLAKLSEAEKQTALEEQKRLADEARIAQGKADQKRIEVQNALARLEATTQREESNRKALTSLEQGEYEQALYSFQKLLESYENESEPMSPEFRTQGKWWASHNLGIVNTYINRFDEAEKFYKKALDILGEPQIKVETTQSNYSRQYFQPVSYQTGTAVNRSKIATLRRLAQLYRMQVKHTTGSEDWEKFTALAVKSYNRLLELMEKETFGKKQMADVYVELADALADSYERESYEKAEIYYIKAAEFYQETRNFVQVVDVLKKMSDLDLYQQATVATDRDLLVALKIQEDEKAMNLPPVNLEIADTYNRLARVLETGGGDSPVKSSNYAALARLIGDLNFKINIKNDFNSTDVRALADAYVKIGKCRKAEEVYFYAISAVDEISAVNDKQAEYVRGKFIYPYIYNEMADFYQNVLRDNQKTQDYFDKFVAENEKSPLLTYLADATSIDFIREDLYERAGDFYLDRGNYAQADKLYEFASKIIEGKQTRSTARKYSDYGLRLISAKSENLIKKANLYEVQNKLPEAEAKYSEALTLNTVSSENIRDVEVGYIRYVLTVPRARVLIRQADFYERHGNKQKTLDIYSQLEKDLNNPGLPPAAQKFAGYAEELNALKGIVYKKLGDFNRDVTATAAVLFYQRAISALNQFNNPSSKNQYAPYFKDNKLNAKYYSDLAEAYESWISLGVNLRLDTKIMADRVRKRADELKLEEQSPCEKDK